jgi:hypothetical protein
MENCCEFGMRLATVETKEKFTCMQQLDIGNDSVKPNLQVVISFSIFSKIVANH